jgi:rubredoxin
MEAVNKYYLIKINLPGGIASVGSLMEILKLFRQAEIDDISFGSRQQLIGYIKHHINRDFLLEQLSENLKARNISFEANTDIYPNIISSYCAEDVFVNSSWVTEGVYNDIIDQIDFNSKLKINISNPDQSFTPFFTGNINFIASSQFDYWYMYVRPKQSNELVYFPALINTYSIGKVCKIIEKFEFSHYPDKNYFIDYLMQHDFVSMIPQTSLELPSFKLPYYEGFNRYGDKTWLGIYRRKEKFRLDFMMDLCELCIDTKIGQICCTPWKSLIIKNIESKYRERWDILLGKYGINVRHAANELNWHLEDYAPEAIDLKRHVIRQYDDFDIRTFGLSFAVQMKPKSEVFGSVVIKEKKSLFGLSKSYSIYHTEDFNPNTRALVLFEENTSKANLAGVLYQITRSYYNTKLQVENSLKTNIVKQKPKTKIIHQCPSCLTVYDDKYGDIVNDIPIGVKFEYLPETYSCPICESPKNEFKSIEVPDTVSL